MSVSICNLPETINTSNKRKGKEEYLYSAFIGLQRLVSRRSDMDHTVYLQITPCLPLLRKRSPDGASTECGGEHIISGHW